MDRSTDRPGDPGQPPGTGATAGHRHTGTPRGPGKRGVDKKFRWRAGHEPDYAEPSSGWLYIKWDITEHGPTPPNQIREVVGGPEAFPCDRCGTIMRIVARKKPTEIIEASDVIRLEEKADTAKVNRDDVYLVCCPQCDRRTQMPGRILRELVYRKTGRLIS